MHGTTQHKISNYFRIAIPQSVSRQVHSLPQRCELVLALSIHNILAFPEGHPVDAYAFFIVFSSLLTFPLF